MFKLKNKDIKNKLSLIGFLSIIPLFLLLEIMYILSSLFNQTVRGKYILEKLTFNEFCSEDLEKQVAVWTKEVEKKKAGIKC